jgi:hypothetical protein
MAFEMDTGLIVFLVFLAIIALIALKAALMPQRSKVHDIESGITPPWQCKSGDGVVLYEAPKLNAAGCHSPVSVHSP